MMKTIRQFALPCATACALLPFVVPVRASSAAPSQPQKPALGEIRVKGHYEHPMSRWNIAVRISDPWHPGDYFLYRLPEGLHVNGESYIRQAEGVSQWQSVQPDAAPEWRIDESERSTGYTIRFYNGIELSVDVAAGDADVTFRYVLRNGTGSTIKADTGSCFMLWTAPHFVDRRQNRTFVWVRGKPVALGSIPPTPVEKQRWPYTILGVGRVMEFEETKVRWMRNTATDHGLICFQSQDGTKTAGLAWAPAESIFARSTIPCLHSEPAFPEIPPGRAIQATGRLYFSEAGIGDILQRYEQDLASGVLHVRVID